jgi:prevent-host-death family protein
MYTQWQLQDAKNRFSQVVKLAVEQGPQFITLHGKPAAVILSIDEYRNITRKESKLSEFLRESPVGYGELDLDRDKSQTREVDL